MRVEVEVVGREERVLLLVLEGSRTAAMTVVLGRERRVLVRPRPMPRFAPVMR